jgi:hypothetical protein
MANKGPEQSPFRSSRRRYQFGLATLLLLAIPVSLLAASLGGMLGQGGAGREIPPIYFLLMCIATPLGLAVAAGVVHWLRQTWRSSRRHEGEEEDP